MSEIPHLFDEPAVRVGINRVKPGKIYHQIVEPPPPKSLKNERLSKGTGAVCNEHTTDDFLTGPLSI